jgi:hypothetical protein
MTIIPFQESSGSGLTATTLSGSFRTVYCPRGSEPIPADLLQHLSKCALLHPLLLSEDKYGVCFTAYFPFSLPKRCRIGFKTGYRPVLTESQ